MASVRMMLVYAVGGMFIAALSVGITLVIVGNRSEGPGIEIALPTATPAPELKIHISGSVATPGVYAMKEGDRLEDGIRAAGGFTEDAQVSCINLALRVRDETHYQIPGAGGPCQGQGQGQEQGPVAASRSVDDSLRIDLNTATAKLLETLPGIGPVRAQSIVDHREKNGPFQSVEQVMEVSGIGPGTYEGIRDLVYVGGP